MRSVHIVLTDEHEQLLQKWARKRYGSRKGALNKLVAQLVEWEKERRVKIQEAIDLMRHSGWSAGLKPGERFYKERGELYDRD